MKVAGFARWVGTVLVVAALSGFFYWTAASDYPGTPLLDGLRTDYYNRLVHGFLDGRLAMEVPSAPETHATDGKPGLFLLDASFYRGRYYLYFGVVPALMLFLPWTVLTASDLPEWAAGAFLAAATLAVAVTWLAVLRRKFFPRLGGGMWLVAVAGWGLGSGLPVVLRRSLFYEVAIISGCLWTFAGLIFLTLAVSGPKRSGRWLALASGCAGLAAGSRPTLIPGALAALAVVAGWCWWRGAGEAGDGWARARRLAGATLLPVGACLGGLAWYNWARFGNPFEFGLNYQIGAHVGGFPFTLASLGANLRLYYFTPPDVGWYFPFFAPGPKPLGSYFEQVHGQFYSLPLLVLAAGAGGWAWWRRQLPGPLATLILAAAVGAGSSLVIDGMAPVHSNRYQLDFHPVLLGLVLLAVFAGAGSPRTRWLARTAAAWLGFVALYNVCISFQVHDFFQESNPRAYAAIARVGDRLAWPLYRRTQPAVGGMELAVVFPEGQPGRIEPLLVAGAGPDADGLMVRYTAAARAQVLFVHQSLGTVETPEFDTDPGRLRRLDVRLGTLCPPPWHPWYDSRPPGSARQRYRVGVWLDGVEVLDRDAPVFQASPNQVVVGERGQLLVGADRFSGSVRLVRSREFDDAWWRRIRAARGPVRLEVRLAAGRLGVAEPLLTTGTRFRTDVVAIRNATAGTVELGLQHKGAETRWSAPMPVDYGRAHEITIDLDSLPPLFPGLAGPPVRDAYVSFDGQVMIREPFAAYPAEPWQVYIGSLPWSFGGDERLFAGQIRVRPRPGDAVAQAAAALAAGRPLEMTVLFPRSAAGAGEPILTTGIHGRGDGLYVRYLGANRVQFGFDHWGEGGPVSAVRPIDLRTEHRLVVSWGALLAPTDPAARRMRLCLDDRVVLEARPDFYRATRSQVAVGRNPIGMSTSEPAFSGRILSLAAGVEVTNP